MTCTPILVLFIFFLIFQICTLNNSEEEMWHDRVYTLQVFLPEETRLQFTKFPKFFVWSWLFFKKPLLCHREVLAKQFFGEGGRRRKSRGRNLKISTFWLSQVLVCLEAQYDAINEQQSSTFSASFPFSRQMCWQHGTFFKGTQFYGSWSLSKARVATSFWLPRGFSSKITVLHAK